MKSKQLLISNESAGFLNSMKILHPLLVTNPKEKRKEKKKIEKYFAHIKKSTTFAPVIERQRY